MDGITVFARIISGNGAARFDGIGADPADDEFLANDVGGFGQGGFDGVTITSFKKEGFIIGAILPDCLRTGLIGGFRGQNCWKRCVIDNDLFGGVFGLAHRFGNDQGDRLAHMTDPVAGQGRARRTVHGRTVPALAGRRAQNIPQAVGGIFLTGEHCQYARHGSGGIGIDGSDIRVGIWRSQKNGIGLVGKRYVVGKPAVAGQ